MKGTFLLQQALQDKPILISDRRFLHSHPGVGFDLEDTKDYVAKALKNIGIEPIPCGKAGLVGLIGGQKPGKVFLLRADMDALPIREEADVEFAAQNGKMHACGHDMHTAMLLEAARLLKQQEKELQGIVKLMFQPAEEILEGSHDMIQAGVLKNPKADAGLMIHVMADMPFPPGTAIVSSGGVSAPAADYFTIQVQGEGCHGSMPNLGIDPISVAAHIILALQEIHARELAPADDAILTIGSIRAGEAGNAIPDTAELHGTLRAYDEEVRTRLKTRMSEIATYTAQAFQAKATITFGSGCPTLLNDADLSAHVLKYIREINGLQMAYSTEELASMSQGGKVAKNVGSEDFAYVSHEIPTIMLALAAGQPDKGFIYPQHHPRVEFDEEALPMGAAIYAYTAMRWLEEHP